MFAKLSHSWAFARLSYGIAWDFKKLLILPIISGIAAMLVSASFLLPLWGMGTLEQWSATMESDNGQHNIAMYITAFAFYFCNYFVIVYFNAALAACALQVTRGEVPSLRYGLSTATSRLPQILAWAGVSAVVGVLLKVIENANEKVGRFISAILGTAWTAMTYFVVPLLVVEGVGPFKAIKKSMGVLKETWGEALVGNFSMGLLAFVIMLPVLVVVGAAVYWAIAIKSLALTVLFIALGVVLIVFVMALNSAADVIFQAVLYNYATGQSIPERVDEQMLRSAFAPRE